MNRYALSEAIKKSPKILRTVRQNKSPIILDSSYSLKEEPYCKISQKEIDSRLDLLKKNTKFIELIKSILADEAEEKQGMNQTDLYPEETIYKGFPSEKDKKLMTKFHETDWNEKVKFIDKFDNPNLSFFAKVLAYEESPDSLPKSIYKDCLLYTSPSPRDLSTSRMPSSA